MTLNPPGGIFRMRARMREEGKEEGYDNTRVGVIRPVYALWIVACTVF